MSQPGDTLHLETKKPHKPSGKERVERVLPSVDVLYSLQTPARREEGLIFSNSGQEVQILQTI